MAPSTTGAWRPSFPPQHGAWAFLLVPLILAAFLGAATWVGLLFAVTWVIAYPATYYGSRAAMTRIRRGSWSRIARRELRDGIPWLVVAAMGVLALLLLRPWAIVPGVAVVIVWGISAWLTWIGRERGIANDLLLVFLSALAVPLMWAVATDMPSLGAIPHAIWFATVVCAVFFAGSVIHVKSLIREADDPRWRVANIVYHVAALITATLASWWLVPAFAVALIRAVALRPGLKPGRIGMVEAVVSVLVIAGTVLAVR